MFCFHKWHKVQTEFINTFLDVEYTDYFDSNFRLCIKCGRIQQYSLDCQGGYYSNLSDKETEIFMVKYSDVISKYMRVKK